MEKKKTSHDSSPAYGTDFFTILNAMWTDVLRFCKAALVSYPPTPPSPLNMRLWIFIFVLRPVYQRPLCGIMIYVHAIRYRHYKTDHIVYIFSTMMIF